MFSKAICLTIRVFWLLQAHFGCISLPGAEMEDDGGMGTAGGHWDERTLGVRVPFLIFQFWEF